LPTGRQADDEEFCLPRVLLSASEEQLLDLDDNIRFVVPIPLDNVAVELGPWSG
jgi:hypothetical protein